jgi:DNA-binding beta-propeller fold protein YncE
VHHMKKIQRLSAYLLCLMLLLLSISLGAATVHADEGAPTYNYSFWGDSVAAPDAYQAKELINGKTLGVTPFNQPNDLHVTNDNKIYVLDSGNNRIVILNQQFKEFDRIESFINEGKKETFSNPQGLFVTEDKQVLIADTGNQRVIHLDQDLNLVKIIKDPQSELLKEDFEFKPVRVVMDKANRIFVMAAGVFDGFMEFNVNGTFTTFVGANRVKVDPIEYLWKRLSTRAQRSQMVMFTPTEFTNLDINEEGFIYATNGDKSEDTIKKLNARGTDILRREGYFSPSGDIKYPLDIGPSRLIDIDVKDSEMYSVLDTKQGRIFTYNGDGHLMYVFGSLGNQLGEFHTPVAIERLGDDFLVLDKELGEITVFHTTAYGRTLNEAVRSYYRGEEEEAFELFKETVNMNANLEFAYTGIGKALLRQGDYKEAMHNFKQSLDQRNYSKAFLLYRKEVLREHFSTVMTVIMIVAASILVFRKRRKMMTRGERGVSVE